MLMVIEGDVAPGKGLTESGKETSLENPWSSSVTSFTTWWPTLGLLHVHESPWPTIVSSSIHVDESASASGSVEQLESSRMLTASVNSPFNFPLVVRQETGAWLYTSKVELVVIFPVIASV